MSPTAYHLACREAYDLVRTCAESIKAQIAAGEVTDDETLTDALHETCDSALTYTHTHYVCAWGLRDSDDFDDLECPLTWGGILSLRAYCNLRSAVADQEDWTALIAVAADAREERGES